MLFLTDRIMDPLLYVIVTGLCAIRRLFHTHSPLAHQLWDEVLLAKPPRGPCSTMTAYLSKLSWIPSPGGLIDLPSGHQLCLQSQSTSEIRMQCRLAWAFYVHSNVRHRKGITPVPGDVYTQIKIMKQLSTREQKLVALNITGGYQTAAVKVIWDSTQSSACEHCGQPDTRLHRLLDCPPFQHVRDQHPEAVQIIAAHPHLAWLPLTTQHPDKAIQVFTDGTCDTPKLQKCCKAAWAAIRQVRVSPSDPSLNDFDILQVSHVKGSQTINRGELEAVVWVAEFYAAQVPRPLIDLYTDSSFVQKIVHSLSTCLLDPRTYRLAHYDLIRRLQMSWDPCLFQLHKVKSHRDYADASNLPDLYTILGNTVADETAKLINRQDIEAFRQAAENIRIHSQKQMEALLCVYKYLCTLNSLQSSLRIEKESAENAALHEQGLDEISLLRKTLTEWEVQGPQWVFEGPLPDIVAHACPVGAQLATCVWKFFQTLIWRHPDQSLDKYDYGITWYELVLHFTLFAGRCLPIWIKVADHQPAHPFAFFSDEVKLQKPEVRSLWHQATNFRHVVQYLEHTAKVQLYPRYKKTGASTLVRLGFHRSLVGGIASRPTLPQRVAAMQLLRTYATIPEQPYPLNVRLPFVPNLSEPILVTPLPDDIPFLKRQNLYQKVKKCLRTNKSLDSIPLSLVREFII